MAIRYLLYGLALIFLLIMALLAAVALTGHDKRSYSVLNQHDVVIVDGKTIRISDLASKYMPKMYLRPSTPSPPLLFIWYEAALAYKTIDFIYYFVWENEVNPNKIIHKLYSVFRAAYYGTAPYDIEYFQVNVDRANEAVIRLRFETSNSDDYYQVLQEHIVAHITLKANGDYEEVRTSQDGKELSRSPLIQVEFESKRVRVGVQTWNHLSRLLNNQTQKYNLLQEAPLAPLSERDYSRYKLARRSQGDYKTKESNFKLPGVSILIFMFTFLIAWLIRMMNRHKKKI